MLKAGRIIQEGNAEELYRAPLDLFVARLFSEVAEIRARVAGGSVETPFGRVPADGYSDGVEVVLCLRQRSISVLAPGRGTAARVLGRRSMGAWVSLHLAVEGLDAPITLKVEAEGAPQPGAEIGLEVDAATVSIFPADGKFSQ